MEQRMGVLPTNRVNISAPFHSSGVDMAGPIAVKMNGRATHKVYIALFTCMSTRAVHLEIVNNINAEEFITRCVNLRRGAPALLSWSLIMAQTSSQRIKF